MPYSGPGDSSLPDNVKEMDEDQRAQWVEVFNSVMEKCTEDGGEAGECETSAFAQANGVIKKQEDGEEEDRTMSPASLTLDVNFSKVLDKIKRAFVQVIEDVFGDVFTERRIKDVESWDGSASNYEDSVSYCRACLINVNPQAGKSDQADWTQENCMLPVRGPGDSGDTYVRQAVYAAAGGRGISAVKRPDDVPEEAWSSAVKAAANKIISAYDQMDEQAPDGVYQAAGKEPPEGRAVSIQTIYGEALTGLERAGIYPMDMYEEGGALFAIGTMEGRLYKVPVIVGEDGSVGLGEAQLVTVNFPPAGERSIAITRQADGRYRWTALACTAILNRSGEIDTRALFDKFVERAEKEGYPEIDFYHVTGTDMGQADYIARDGYSFVASGLFEDSNIGRAAAEGLAADPGFWGCSILYSPLARELVIACDGIDIPAYTDGILRKITILPEREAAALFTTMEVERMNDKIKAALQKLLGNELADEMEARVDGVNRRVEDEQLVARSTEAEVPVEPVAEQAPVETTLTETDAVIEMRRALDETRAQLATAVETIKTMAETMETRLAQLERTDEERKRAWLNDLPEKKRQPAAPIWRPREAVREEGNETQETAAQIAERSWKEKTKGGA